MNFTIKFFSLKSFFAAFIISLIILKCYSLLITLSIDNWKIITNQLKTVSLQTSQYLSELETQKNHFKGNDVYISQKGNNL